MEANGFGMNGGSLIGTREFVWRVNEGFGKRDGKLVLGILCPLQKYIIGRLLKQNILVFFLEKIKFVLANSKYE